MRGRSTTSSETVTAIVRVVAANSAGRGLRVESRGRAGTGGEGESEERGGGGGRRRVCGEGGRAVVEGEHRLLMFSVLFYFCVCSFVAPLGDIRRPP